MRFYLWGLVIMLRSVLCIAFSIPRILLYCTGDALCAVGLALRVLFRLLAKPFAIAADELGVSPKEMNRFMGRSIE